MKDFAPNHNGGQLQFGPDGRLYWGNGDGGGAGDPGGNGQSLARPFAKIMRLNINAKNPRWSLVAYGLRNPWRFSFDGKTGDLYIGDVGQDNWEEIDYLKRGTETIANFGWNRFEGTHVYDGITKMLTRGVYHPPVAEYSHEDGCSVTGGYVYRGTKIPSAVGRYFYGDYCSGLVWSLKIVGGKATGVRREPFTLGGLSSFAQGADGRAVPHVRELRRLLTALRMTRVLLVVAVAAIIASTASSADNPASHDWPVYGYDTARHNASPDAAITVANVSQLRRRRVELDGTVDSSPIYAAKGVRGHDAFLFTTTYGKTEAVDAAPGACCGGTRRPRTRTSPGSAQITNATPALSTDRTAVYAAAPDGRIRKLRLSDGHVLWTTRITFDPTHEKITSSLNVLARPRHRDHAAGTSATHRRTRGTS